MAPSPLPWTLLSLHRYAKIMGINPMHFAGGATPALHPEVMPSSTCSMVWRKYQWQSSVILSHEDIVLAIQEAEDDLARLLGYWPGPVWSVEEDHEYPKYFDPLYYQTNGSNIRGKYKAIKANWGKFTEAGQRAVSIIGTATTAAFTLTYSDAEPDGYFETATIVLPCAITNLEEIHCYHAGYAGDPDWEIRPCRSKVVTAGVLTMVFYSWQLIKPNLYDEFPTLNEPDVLPIDISTVANFVTSVDVYREYTNFNEVSSKFYWENSYPDGYVNSCSCCGGVGCEACLFTTQEGCLHPRNPEMGILVPVPADYDEVNCQWTSACFTECRDPDLVKFWYRSGDYDQKFLRRLSYEPLSDEWARMIAYLATARLDKPPCSCPAVSFHFEDLQRDLSFSGQNIGQYFITPTLADSPLGTRKGEIYAYRKLKYKGLRQFNATIV